MTADHLLVAVLVSVCSELARCYFLQALQLLSTKKTQHNKTESDPYTGMPLGAQFMVINKVGKELFW